MQQIINQVWENRELLKEKKTQHAIGEIIDLLDKGKLRIAEPKEGV